MKPTEIKEIGLVVIEESENQIIIGGCDFRFAYNKKTGNATMRSKFQLFKESELKKAILIEWCKNKKP